MVNPPSIQFQGLRTHNLKNLSVRIPHHRITVIAGPSGSGKSSLAMDSIYAESIRLFVDSMGLPPSLIPKYEAEFDRVSGLLPTLCLDASQDYFAASTRLGDLADIHNWLRQLFCQYGTWTCPTCQRKLEPYTAAKAARLLENHQGQRAWFCTPIACKGNPEETRNKTMSQGFVRAWQNGAEVEIQDWQAEETLWVVVDRAKIGPSSTERIQEAIAAAWKFSPLCRVQIDSSFVDFSPLAYCAEHDFSGHELRPYFWNARHSQGACPHCKGTGFIDNQTCHICQGSGIKAELKQVQLSGFNWNELQEMPLKKLLLWTNEILQNHPSTGARRIAQECHNRIQALIDLGLDYLSLGRSSQSLSTGERQRARLSSLLGQSLSGVCYVFDEISAGLHPKDITKVLDFVQRLRDKGNTLILVDHHRQVLDIADQILELGPQSGDLGGQVIFEGQAFEISHYPESLLGAWAKRTVPKNSKRPPPQSFLEIHGALGRNLRVNTVKFAESQINMVCGVSGAGKSNLIMDTLCAALIQLFKGKCEQLPLAHDKIIVNNITDIVVIETGVHQGSKRSSPASLIGLLDEFRNLFAALPESEVKGLKASAFSPNVKGGRCEVCKGEGIIQSEMGPLGLCEEECPECLGHRFQSAVLAISFKGKNIDELLRMQAQEASAFFRNHPRIKLRLDTMLDLGLGYLQLGRSCQSLSAGEMQRLRLAKEFFRPKESPTLFVLDEPSRGLFYKDLDQLALFLGRLCDKGHTVICIDHNPELVQNADWIVEMGPQGGEHGGEIVYAGPFDASNTEFMGQVGR